MGPVRADGCSSRSGGLPLGRARCVYPWMQPNRTATWTDRGQDDPWLLAPTPSLPLLPTDRRRTGGFGRLGSRAARRVCLRDIFASGLLEGSYSLVSTRCLAAVSA